MQFQAEVGAGIDEAVIARGDYQSIGAGDIGDKSGEGGIDLPEMRGDLRTGDAFLMR